MEIRKTLCALVAAAAVGLGVSAKASLIEYYGYASQGEVTKLQHFDSNWERDTVGDSGMRGYGADFSPDGSIFYVVGRMQGDFVLSEIDPSDGSRGRTVIFPEITEAITINPNNPNQLFFVSNYSGIKKYDIDTGNVTNLIENTGWNALQSLDFSPDGRLFAIDSNPNWLVEFDPITGNEIDSFRLSGTSDINSLDISPRGRIIALTTSPGGVYEINLENRTAEFLATTDMGFDSIASIPEPSTLALLGAGLGAYALRRRK